MNLFSSLLLGVLQGLTEFLPVSSSGHLVLAQYLIPGFSQPGVLFDVVLHLGTLFAIVAYFRKAILDISRKYLFLIAVGTIPAVLFGFLFQSAIEDLFRSVQVVGFALLLTAAMNYLTDWEVKKNKKISTKMAGVVGLAQALAIIPGVSRSGSTIFAGTRLGIAKKKAARFSFLLSIPAVAGANVLQLASHASGGSINPLYYFAGFLAAFISGYLAIGIVFRVLLSRRFRLFAAYCLLVAFLVILLL